MTSSHDDEKLADLISRFGHAGYGVWWLVVEIVASVLETGKEPEVTYPVSKWSHLLSVRGSHVVSTLVKLEVTHLVTVVRHDDDITVRIPNLLKYRDEYSRKSGQGPESVRSKNRDRERTDTEQRSDVTSTTIPDRFAEFIEPWPRVAKPDQAARMWISVIDTPADEAAAFAARDRYLASEEVSRGIVGDPARWLQDQKSAKWAGKWPGKNGNGSTPYRKDDWHG